MKIVAIGRAKMGESFGVKVRRFLYQGWTGKPAYIRAFGWLLLGVILGVKL